MAQPLRQFSWSFHERHSDQINRLGLQVRFYRLLSCTVYIHHRRLLLLATFPPEGREPAHINAEADDDGKNHRYTHRTLFTIKW